MQQLEDVEPSNEPSNEPLSPHVVLPDLLSSLVFPDAFSLDRLLPDHEFYELLYPPVFIREPRRFPLIRSRL